MEATEDDKINEVQNENSIANSEESKRKNDDNIKLQKQVTLPQEIIQ